MEKHRDAQGMIVLKRRDTDDTKVWKRRQAQRERIDIEKCGDVQGKDAYRDV